jgi:hypothetical protein
MCPADTTPTPPPPVPTDPTEPPTPEGPGSPEPPSVQPSSTPEGPQTIPAPSTPVGEPGPDPEDFAVAAGVEESTPNAGGREGAAGGMGVSSQRDPSDVDEAGIEGTGSVGGAVTEPEGTLPPAEPGSPSAAVGEQPPGSSPGAGAEFQGVDRAVGEENPARVPPHEFEEETSAGNPGSSH